MKARPFLSSSWYRVAKLRPKLREHATINRHRYRGSVWYVVHDHATGLVHRLSPASYAIVAAMDGKRSVDQLWQEAGIQLGEEAPTQDDLMQLLVQLNAVDLLQTEATPDSAELCTRAMKARRSRWLQNIFNPLALRVRIWHPDRFFERSLPNVKWLIGWGGLALWMLVVLPAVMLAAQHWPELTANASQRTLAVDNLWLLALSYPILKALHELGHGYAVKAFGGTVHELGVMFLVFAPVPYVDASAASEFRSKWRRALVGAAGMIVEVFLAALAMYVWLAVEEGFVRALAYNVMLIAGVSTVIFNGNPLLRYDGYYILCDILEIPNLGQRATRFWGYLIERYVFLTEDFREFFVTRGERIWLLLYAPASFLYRVAVMLAIAIFIASEYLAVGIAIALWGLFTGVFWPIGKVLWQVIAAPRFQRNRRRVVATTFGSLITASVILLFVPLPAFTTTEGVVWLPDSAIVRAGTDGFVRRLLVEQGERVTAGEALVESEEPGLDAKLTSLKARVAELEATTAAERLTARVKAELTAMELAHVRAELATQTDRARRLIVRSQGEGMFAVLKPQDLPGRFIREGQEIAYVLPPSAHIIRATIRQADIDLVRNRLRGVRIRLAERLDEILPARLLRMVPAGRKDAPGNASDDTGAGPVPIDLRDPQAKELYHRVFHVDLELPDEISATTAFGSRVYVRFDLEWEPLAQQVWRRARQLLLSRLQS
jgi:putative peptide zinc metalloprotease protein